MTHFPEATLRARSHIKPGCRQQGVLVFPFTPGEAREIPLINQGEVTSDSGVNAPQGAAKSEWSIVGEDFYDTAGQLGMSLESSLRRACILCTHLSLEDGTWEKGGETFFKIFPALYPSQLNDDEVASCDNLTGRVMVLATLWGSSGDREKPQEAPKTKLRG